MEQTISVIVPVYNCKEYLNKCIESILGQTYPHLQLILVDDGSTDGSGDICDTYSKDPRIFVQHQINGGVSKARNTGLDIATGDWLMFVDSDDYVERDYCQRMLDASVKCHVDAVIAHPFVNYQPEVYKYTPEQIEQLKQACLAYDETRFDYNIDAPWGKLFRRTLIEKYSIRFPEDLSRSEDAYFCATVYEHSADICCMNWFGYVHVEREGSLCHRFAPESPAMLEQILRENQYWVQKYHPGEDTYEKALWHRVLQGIDECEKLYFFHVANPNSRWMRLKEYQSFLSHGLTYQSIRKLRITDIPKRQYRRRLWFYKLRLGWLFMLLKALK